MTRCPASCRLVRPAASPALACRAGATAARALAAGADTPPMQRGPETRERLPAAQSAARPAGWGSRRHRRLPPWSAPEAPEYDGDCLATLS